MSLQWIFYILTFFTGIAVAYTEPEAKVLEPHVPESVSVPQIKMKSKATALIFGKKEIFVKAKASGEIKSVGVDEGGEVKVGQELAVIDDKQPRAERELASMEFKTASDDLVKTRRLKKYVSREEIRLKEDTYHSKKTALEIRDINLINTHIAAPIDGVITRRYIEAGETTQAGDRAFQIVQIGELVMVAYISSVDAIKIKTGSELTFTVDELKDVKFKAVVTFVSPVIDSPSETVRVKLDASNVKKSEDGTYLLKPGMIANLEF
ncbi:MAG: efflux RND transporter periplasmic adaptor subunit [Oligoflexia bacterium]|nr:efflux RND transporter periplasmic adaptor subunit [Oligoflexia bacterium]